MDSYRVMSGGLQCWLEEAPFDYRCFLEVASSVVARIFFSLFLIFQVKILIHSSSFSFFHPTLSMYSFCSLSKLWPPFLQLLCYIHSLLSPFIVICIYIISVLTTWY